MSAGASSSGHQQPPALLFEQVRAGWISAEAMEWLSDGFRIYDRTGLPLERALGLPSAKQRRRLVRDYWLAEAGRLAPGRDREAATLPAIAAAIGKRLDEMKRSAAWQRAIAGGPLPPAASDFDHAVVEVARQLGGRARPCDKRIAQLLAAAEILSR